MTKAGEKWALEKAGGSFVFESEEAEFWISVFVAEVEKRAAGIEGGSNEDVVYLLIDLAREEAVGQAFDELQRELLGEK